jgi:Ca2+-binding EF-hand superfamily protein
VCGRYAAISKSSLGETIALFDTDSDGLVSQDELTHVLSKCTNN